MVESEFHTLQLHEEERPQRPSKTELKRRSGALRDLGDQLLQLTSQQLNRMGLPNELLEALHLAQAMRRDGAYARQRKYIGKLLRAIDTAPIEAKLADIAVVSASANRSLHQIEAWRDRLIAAGDTALADLMTEFPLAERPKLRSLIETARRERQQEQAPRAARLIFKYLRSLIETR